MIVLRLLAVFIVTALLTGCDDINTIKIDADALREDIKALKTDIKLLRGFLMQFPTPTECPAPGVPTTKICKYKLQVKRQIDGHKNYWAVTIPSEVVTKGKTDCDKVTKSHEDLKNYPCVDPANYKYWEYAVYIEGDVKVNDIKMFVNDPITNHLKVVKEV